MLRKRGGRGRGRGRGREMAFKRIEGALHTESLEIWSKISVAAFFVLGFESPSFWTIGGIMSLISFKISSFFILLTTQESKRN